jgi:hypothetical protein
MFPCPCCGYEVFDGHAGSFDICPICYWEDDVVQLVFPDLAGGANKYSLIEGQRNYRELGACEERLKANVRLPLVSDLRNTKWRPLDPTRDQLLKWDNRDDHQLWQKVKDRPQLCLYYWLPDYWLSHESR